MKHQCCFLFDCCIVIARFASLSCYSSAKTRIQLIKLYHLNNKSQSYTQIKGLRLEFPRIQSHLALQHPQLPPPTLKKSVIILPSLANKHDSRLKGTEKVSDHLEEELLSQSELNQIHQCIQNIQSWLSHLQ